MNLNKNQPSKVLFGDNQLEVSNNCQYTYQDKPNTHQIVEYLGEDHHYYAENQSSYSGN